MIHRRGPNEWRFAIALADIDALRAAMRIEVPRVWTRSKKWVEQDGCDERALNYALTEGNPAEAVMQLRSYKNSPDLTYIDTNFMSGYPALCSNLARLNPGLRVIDVSSAPRGTVEWPIEQIVVFEAGFERNRRRVIRVFKEERGWSFYEAGDRFDFEEVDRYDEKPTHKKFDRPMIQRYLVALGVDIVPILEVQQPHEATHFIVERFKAAS